MRFTLDSLATMTLAGCALVVTGLLIHHEFSSLPDQRPTAGAKPAFIKDWRSDLSKGVRIGNADAPVQVIEFADFECPYCASFQKNLKALEIGYPGKVTLTYVHYPLPGHRFALPAARAAECADEQGRFEPMHDLLFEEQDAFGLKSWSEFASAAGVPDGAAFEVCTKRTEAIPRVAVGMALGKQLDVRGTPTIVINGWKLGRPPTGEELEGMVRKILAGKSPVS